MAAGCPPGPIRFSEAVFNNVYSVRTIAAVLCVALEEGERTPIYVIGYVQVKPRPPLKEISMSREEDELEDVNLSSDDDEMDFGQDDTSEPKMELPPAEPEPSAPAPASRPRAKRKATPKPKVKAKAKRKAAKPARKPMARKTAKKAKSPAKKKTASKAKPKK